MLDPYRRREARQRAAIVMELALVSALGISSVVEARITRLEITHRESPTFDGASFGDVGPFEKFVGTASDRSIPHHQLNAIIQVQSWAAFGRFLVR